LAIANGLKADVTALQQATRNANDGIALIQIADGALSKISDLLTRAVTLAEQSASETVGANERGTINTEYQQILQEINRVVSVSNFKGERLFSESGAVRKSIYVGDTQMSSFITVSIAGAGGAGTTALGLGTSNVSSASSAITALGELKNAIASVPNGEVRWALSRTGSPTRWPSSRCSRRICRPPNHPSGMPTCGRGVNMTKYQILLQSGMASLAQANASSQLVLSLLQ
jgi:flagellin